MIRGSPSGDGSGPPISPLRSSASASSSAIRGPLFSGPDRGGGWYNDEDEDARDTMEEEEDHTSIGYPVNWRRSGSVASLGGRSTLSDAGRRMLSTGGSSLNGLAMSRSGTSSLSSLAGPAGAGGARVSMTRSTRGFTVPATLPKPRLNQAQHGTHGTMIRLDWQGEHYRHPRRQASTTGVLALSEVSKNLPPDWIAVSSHRNNQTFFFNTRTRKAQWTKPWRELPADLPPPPPPPKPVCNHAECKGLSFCQRVGPKFPTDDDLDIRASEHELVSMDFSLALMMHGPKILLAKILLANVLYCFEQWREGAKINKHEREELLRRSATLIQAHWRRVMVINSLFERYREYHRRLKCHDFPDIRAELKQLLTAMPTDTAEWFVDFKGSYMKQMVGNKKKTYVPDVCGNETCNQPGYLVQKNGLCRQCNYFARFPEKAALGTVTSALETPTKKRQEQQRLERIRQRKRCYYLRKDDLLERGRDLMGLKTGLTM